MLDKQAYNNYLVKKKQSEKLMEERLWLLGLLEEAIVKNGGTSADDMSENDITAFTAPWNVSGRANYLNTIAAFLKDYAKFIDNEGPKLSHVATVIRQKYRRDFEALARSESEKRRKAILPCPNAFIVDPKHLGELTNDEFISAFKQLRQTVISAYEDIEKSPFDWGYPDFNTTEGYYNRVNDILFAFAFNGTYHGGTITVDTKRFFASKGVKRHKKVELMMAGFKNVGFCVDGFSKKSESFNVTYLDNPHVMFVLNTYASGIDVSLEEWKWGLSRHSLSYRLVEDPATQKYETVFHAIMDYASDQLKEIQYWLHDEAAKYGYKIDPNGPTEKGCILYKKGASKRFLLVGERSTSSIYNPSEKHDSGNICAKVSLIDAFETAPDRMRALCNRFPHVFRLEDKGKCCHGNKCWHRMSFTFDGIPYLRCGLAHFIFDDLEMDDVKAILELFIVENGIK